MELRIENKRTTLELSRLSDVVEVSVESGRGTETTYLNREQLEEVLKFLDECVRLFDAEL